MSLIKGSALMTDGMWARAGVRLFQPHHLYFKSLPGALIDFTCWTEARRKRFCAIDLNRRCSVPTGASVGSLSKAPNARSTAPEKAGPLDWPCVISWMHFQVWKYVQRKVHFYSTTLTSNGLWQKNASGMVRSNGAFTPAPSKHSDLVITLCFYMWF